MAARAAPCTGAPSSESGCAGCTSVHLLAPALELHSVTDPRLPTTHTKERRSERLAESGRTGMWAASIDDCVDAEAVCADDAQPGDAAAIGVALAFESVPFLELELEVRFIAVPFSSEPPFEQSINKQTKHTQ
jgi:hypothetical protein